MEPELIVNVRCETGEGPLWHPDDACLYWVDIPKGRLYRFDPSDESHELCYKTDVIGGFTIQRDGSLLLFENEGRVTLWDGNQTKTVIDHIPDERDSRFNDVIADPEGRVFCGTMPTDSRGGRLYRLDTDGSITRLLDGLAIPNGMGFDPDTTRLYLSESNAETIHCFVYNRGSGELTNRSTFLDTSTIRGVPDGLTIDADGYVWVAYWDGGRVVRYSSEGEEITSVEVPAMKVSSLTFGGEGYETAFVTTAFGSSDKSEDPLSAENEGARALFRFNPDAYGRPEYRSLIE